MKTSLRSNSSGRLPPGAPATELQELQQEVARLEQQLQKERASHQRLREAVRTVLPAHVTTFDTQEQLLFVGRPVAPADSLGLAHLALAAAPNPTCIFDERGAVVLANPAYAQLPPAADPASQLPDASCDREDEHVRPDGVSSWFRTTCRPFIGPDEQRYLLVTKTDITALKQAREAAEASSRAKEAFLASISHEVRTPLNGIIGLARLLRGSIHSSPQNTYLDSILSSAEGLLMVLNDVLDFAKIEAGHLELESRPFDVAEVVQHTCEPLRLAAQHKGLRLHIELPAEPLPIVEGDAGRLRQVLLNLLTNALKFTHQGEVTVSVRAERYERGQVHLQFCVADTGIGIAADQFERLFQSFSQASRSTSRLYGGTGLGLAICQRLLHLQGGHIWFDSQPGRGSRFFFALPYTLSEQTTASTDAPAAGTIPDLLHGLRVLLVEDNAINTLLATSLLQGWQILTDVAADGEQALAHALHTPYDLILMDIEMPRLNGLDATARLRSTPGPNQQAPIIALTANALQSEVSTYGDAGFTDWLVKPYHENALYLTIAHNTGRANRPTQVAPAAVASTPAYNFEGLGRLANDATFIRKMQRLFIDTVPPQLSRLSEAATHADWPAARQLAHALKSTYGNLQIAEAVRCVKKIEEILKKNPDEKTILNLLRALRLVTNQMVEIFENNLTKQP